MRWLVAVLTVAVLAVAVDEPAQMDVTLENGLAEPVDVFFNSPEGVATKVAEIPARSESRMRTFPGHVFTFTRVGHDEPLLRVTVVESQSRYGLQPNGDASERAPSGPWGGGEAATAAVDESQIEDYPVACGAAIKLQHAESGYLLHSHEIAWGSGSKQQSVTCQSEAAAVGDPNNLWLVMEAHGAPLCAAGAPVPCGARVRLQHVATRKHLHSHLIDAPLTASASEVSGLGEAGAGGDEGDDWIVECPAPSESWFGGGARDGSSGGSGAWERGARVRLRHASTGRPLWTSRASEFNERNCPGRCPIQGQLEVATTSGDGRDTLWSASAGAFLWKK